MSDMLRWGAATDAGRVRESNEDAHLAEPMVFAVADGMGGHQAGEVASAMAVDVLRQRLVDGAPSVEVVVAAVVEANAAIFQTARRNSAQMGMGTTVTVLAVLPARAGAGADAADPEPLTDASITDTTDSSPTPEPAAEPAPEPIRLALANVGDSRTYLMRDGALTRATIDHSYVQELLATGHLTEDEARNHPRRNIVTRALGIEPSVRVDSWVLPLVRGDRFVLCSDGLVDEIDDARIAEIVAGASDPHAAAEQLVAAALEQGGRDNVTVVVVDVVEGAEPGVDHGTDSAPEPTLVMPVVGSSGVAADPITPARQQPRRRLQMTGRLFAGLVALAVVATAVITLLAVALTGDDPPAPTTTSSTSTTSTTSTTTTTSVPGPSTTAPEPTPPGAATTVGGP
jgi:serine/threonine protein phosphatase PrpC